MTNWLAHGGRFYSMYRIVLIIILFRDNIRACEQFHEPHRRVIISRNAIIPSEQLM